MCCSQGKTAERLCTGHTELHARVHDVSPGCLARGAVSSKTGLQVAVWDSTALLLALPGQVDMLSHGEADMPCALAQQPAGGRPAAEGPRTRARRGPLAGRLVPLQPVPLGLHPPAPAGR